MNKQSQTTLMVEPESQMKAILTKLTEKDVDLESIAEEVVNDTELLSELLEGVLSRDNILRFNSFQVLMQLSEAHPGIVNSEWDFFSDLLVSSNSYFKYIGLYLITSLTSADSEKRFEEISSTFFDLLDDSSVMIAANLARNLGKIAKAKPEMQTEICNRLLQIDDTHHESERKDLIKGYAIEAFDEFFMELRAKKKILEFVRSQLSSKSPRTRKRAKEFLKKWER